MEHQMNNKKRSDTRMKEEEQSEHEYEHFRKCLSNVRSNWEIYVHNCTNKPSELDISQIELSQIQVEETHSEEAEVGYINWISPEKMIGIILNSENIAYSFDLKHIGKEYFERLTVGTKVKYYIRNQKITFIEIL